MKKIIKLTESQLVKLINKVINENKGTINELSSILTVDNFIKMTTADIQELLDTNDGFKYSNKKEKIINTEKAIDSTEKIITSNIIKFFNLNDSDKTKINKLYYLELQKLGNIHIIMKNRYLGNKMSRPLLNNNIFEKSDIHYYYIATEIKNTLYSLVQTISDYIPNVNELFSKTVIDVLPYQKTKFNPDDDLSITIENWLFTFETLEKFFNDFLVDNLDEKYFNQFKNIIDDNIDNLKRYVEDKYYEDLDINPIDELIFSNQFAIKHNLIEYIDELISFNERENIFNKKFIIFLNEFKTWINENW